MHFKESFRKITDNVIPDLRDNFPGLSKIKSWEVSPSLADPHSVERVKEKFISREQYEQLRTAAESAIQSGELFEHTWLVGSKEKGTMHPHTFLAEKSEAGINLFFIDPEHNVGTQNFLRPKISNLIGINLRDSYENSQFSVIRFNVNGLTPDQLKLQQQFTAARELLTAGQPAMLNDLPQNILFQAGAEKGKAYLHARYTNENKAQKFLKGGDGSRALRGKIKANTVIINRLIGFLAEGNFKPTKRFK